MRRSRFRWEREQDDYRCPEERYRHYKSDPAISRQCPLRASCTAAAKTTGFVSKLRPCPRVGPFLNGAGCASHSPCAATRALRRIFRADKDGAGGGTRTPTGLATLRIFLPLRLSPPGRKGQHRSWSGLSLRPIRESGRRRCPSSLYTFRQSTSSVGLARDHQEPGFPEFEQFCIVGFPASTRFWFKSVASTSFATPAALPRLHRAGLSAGEGLPPRPNRTRFQRRLSDVKAQPHFLTWFEIRNAFRRNGHGIASPRITSDPSPPAASRKGAEASKFYTPAFCESFSNCLEKGRNDLFDFFR